MADTPKGQPVQTDNIAREAISYVGERKKNWEEATVWVTDKVAFKMRDLIKTLRRNYFGIFRDPHDSVTGRQKIWIPLTEYVVDNTVKNIDLDTKDINLRAKKQSAIGITAILRNGVKDFLDGIEFGEKLDFCEQTISIDGTSVWKTFEDFEDPDYKTKTMCVEDVDLLNFYIDPTAKSIRDHVRKDIVIERGIMSPGAVKAMTGWHDTDKVATFTGLSVNDSNRGITASSNIETKLVEIFEAWGKFPLFLMTGKEEDRDKMFTGHVVISNLERAPVVHLIEKLKEREVVPYEEARYSKVRGRWYGRGTAEKVMMLQLWLNIIVNIRINRAYVTQLGIFKIKKGQGITPQMISKLTVNGGIMVKDMADIEQMVVQEASQASYRDENIIQQWSQRVTSLFEAVTGENMPSQTTATNGTIQNRSASSQFVFVKKGLGMFLQRWMKYHVFPILPKYLLADEVLRVTGEIDELREVDERIANELLYKKLAEMTAEGKYVNPEQVEKERQRIISSLNSRGRERFVKMLQKINFADYDVEIFVTNEEADKGVLIQNLTQMFQTLPALQDSDIDPNAIAAAVFDLMGIDTTQLKRKRSPIPRAAAAAGAELPAPQGKPVANPQQAVMQAMAIPGQR